MRKWIGKIIPGSLKAKIKSYIQKNEKGLAVSVPYSIIISNPDALKGEVALVTGGSGAIGRAISCRLAAEGATVYVCGTNADKINAVVSEIKDLGGIAYPCRMNLADESDILTNFRKVFDDHGRLDILVNCAGGSARSSSAPIYELKTDIIDNVLDINLRGTILCSREAAKIMMTQNKGKIINISSIVGEKGLAKFSEYAASKAGIIAFTKSIAMEMGKFGVTVNCISPGKVQRGEIIQSNLEKLKKSNYMNSYGKPEDVSEMAAYLISQKASFITGQNFIVDGGRSLGLKIG